MTFMYSGAALCPVKCRLIIRILLALFCVMPGVSAAEMMVNVVSRGDDNANYALQMIKLGLDRAGVSFQINLKDDALSAPKLREELIAGEMDAIWTETNHDMEQNALPIRVPL